MCSAHGLVPARTFRGQVEGPLEGPYAGVFPARRDAFEGMRIFIEDACMKGGVARHDCLRLTLLIE